VERVKGRWLLNLLRILFLTRRFDLGYHRKRLEYFVAQVLCEHTPGTRAWYVKELRSIEPEAAQRIQDLLDYWGPKRCSPITTAQQLRPEGCTAGCTKT
jgi:hypothetical protein